MHITPGGEVERPRNLQAREGTNVDAGPQT